MRNSVDFGTKCQYTAVMVRLRFLWVTAVAAAALAADTASVSGKWRVQLSVGGTDREHSCTFTQKDKDLTGTCDTDQGAVEVSGKIDQNKVAWSYKSEYSGTPLTVAFSGTLDASGKMTGSVTVPEFGVEGEFTATSSK